MKIKLIKFNNNLIAPKRAHYNDAGIDCYAQEDITLTEMQSVAYLTVGEGHKIVNLCDFTHHYSLNSWNIDEYIDYGGLCWLENKEVALLDLKHETKYFEGDIYFPVTVEPQKIALGFGLEIPDGYMATIHPRSSMNAKGILTQIGTIDSGYRGEIKVVLINLTGRKIEIKKGDKICQIVIEPVVLADFVENLGDERGDGGFGSTGR